MCIRHTTAVSGRSGEDCSINCRQGNKQVLNLTLRFCELCYWCKNHLGKRRYGFSAIHLIITWLTVFVFSPRLCFSPYPLERYRYALIWSKCTMYATDDLKSNFHPEINAVDSSTA